MKIKPLLHKLDSRVFAVGGFVMAIASWFFDAGIDITFFNTDRTYLESLLHPSSHETWMRLFESFLLVTLGLITAYLLKLHETAEQELAYSKAMIEKFAIDMETQNAKLQREVELRKKTEQRLAKLATTDPLTGVANRRKFDETLLAEIKREDRYQRGLSLIMLDIDHFKQVNDTLGHDIGDRVLIQLAELIKKNSRESESFFRVGGEEFALLTFDGDTEKLYDAAERLRKIVEGHDFGIGRPVTISLGASRFMADDTTSSLYRRADEALYEAKRSGRNRVVLR